MLPSYICKAKGHQAGVRSNPPLTPQINDLGQRHLRCCLLKTSAHFNESSAEVPWEFVPCLHGNQASNLRVSLIGMAGMCKQNASDAHGKAAKKHALRNNIPRRKYFSNILGNHNRSRFHIRFLLGGTTC